MQQGKGQHGKRMMHGKSATPFEGKAQLILPRVQCLGTEPPPLPHSAGVAGCARPVAAAQIIHPSKLALSSSVHAAPAVSACSCRCVCVCGGCGVEQAVVWAWPLPEAPSVLPGASGAHAAKVVAGEHGAAFVGSGHLLGH